MYIKKIHFIWVDKYNFDESTSRLPKKYEENIQQWKNINKDWEILIWNWEQINILIYSTNNIEIIKLFHEYTNFINRVDLAKLLILYYYGGLYVDIDFWIQKPIDNLFSTDGTLTLVKEPYENLKHYHGLKDEYIISNGIIYSNSINNKLLLEIVNYYIKNKNNNHVLNTTGPIIFNMFYNDKNTYDNIKLLEPNGITSKTNEGFMYTTFDNTWCSSKYFNDDIFKDYYFYPCLKFNNSYIDNSKNNTIVFTTDNKFLYNTYPFTNLTKYSESEFDGTFINKIFFKKSTQYIPKIIHQIWIGNKNKPISLLKKYEDMCNNCNIKYMFWDENRINNEFPDLFQNKLITLCPLFCGKVDIIRLYILKKYGGIYIDSDIQMLGNIPDECWHYELFLSFEDEYNRGNLITNCLIGCKQNHPFIDKMLNIFNEYDKDVYKLPCIVYYGPAFFTWFFNTYLEFAPVIFPSYYWFKYTHDRKRENTYLTTKSVGHHLGCIHPRIEMECSNKFNCIEYIKYYVDIKNYKNILVFGNNVGLISRNILRYGLLVSYPINLHIVSSENEIQKIMCKEADFSPYDENREYDLIINLSSKTITNKHIELIDRNKTDNCIELSSYLTSEKLYLHTK